MKCTGQEPKLHQRKVSSYVLGATSRHYVALSTIVVDHRATTNNEYITSPIDDGLYSNVWLRVNTHVVEGKFGVESLALTDTCLDAKFHVY